MEDARPVERVVTEKEVILNPHYIVCNNVSQHGCSQKWYSSYYPYLIYDSKLKIFRCRGRKVCYHISPNGNIRKRTRGNFKLFFMLKNILEYIKKDSVDIDYTITDSTTYTRFKDPLTQLCFYKYKKHVASIHQNDTMET